MKKFAKKLSAAFKKPGNVSFLSSIVSIVFGLIIGFILLLCFNAPHALGGITKILTTGFSSSDKLGKVLYQAVPLIFTGLSVAFAFKTGLFNIGATGQYTVGAFCALFCAIVLKCPWYVSLLAAALGGAVWGFFPGLFKALFNVNEVITSIMFNWIGLYAVNLMISNQKLMLANSWGASNPDRTANLSAVMGMSGTENMLTIPKGGLDKLFDSKWINIGIFIAVAAALIIYMIINRTTFGFGLRACGYNKNASLYAGIPAKRNIVLSMVIAGALSGIGGGIYFLNGPAQYTLYKVLLTMGFNGIPVALLALSNPIGVIFSALFISYIQVGGDALQPEFAKEIIDIIISVIIYLSAFSLIIRTLIGKFLNRKGQSKAQAGDAPAPESKEENL